MNLFDIHLHLAKRSACSDLSVNTLFRNLSPKLNGIIITDHHILKPMNELQNRGVKVLFGVEITSREGDILAYGITTVPSRGLSAQETIKLIHEQGGVAVAAHPFDPHRTALGDKVFDLELDAIEINGLCSMKQNKQAKRASKILDIPTTGGSDSHQARHLNTYATKFNQRIDTIMDVVDSIKAHRCYAFLL